MVVPTRMRKADGGLLAAWLALPSDDTLPAVLAQLKEPTKDTVATAKVFKALADQCRSPERRTELTTTDLAAASSAMLETAQRGLATGESAAEWVFLVVQVLRCICNLCADNKEARAQVLAAHGVERMAQALQMDEVVRQPLPVGQAAFGAVLNVGMDDDDCTGALVRATGVLDAHLRVLVMGLDENPGLRELWPMVSGSVDALCEHKDALGQFAEHPEYAAALLRVLQRTTELIEGDAGDSMVRGVQRTALWVLNETLEKSAEVREQLCSAVAALGLMDVLGHYLRRGSAGDDSDDGSGEEKDSSPSAPKANRQADAVTQMIVGISGEDAGLEALFGSSELLGRLMAVLEAAHSDAESDGLAAAAALCLGNLARTDAHCTYILREHRAAVQRLVDVWFGDRGVDVRARHAASGVLKNLCLAAANRAELTDLGLARVAMRNIDTAVVPIQANAIGILRHLVGGAETGEAVVSEMLAQEDQAKSALATLLAAVASTDIDGIRCEGTRLAAAVAKRVYLQRDEVSPKAQCLEPYDLVTPLVRLILLDGQRHPLLQQEALVVLSVLAAASTPTAPHASRIVSLLVPANSQALLPVPTDGDDGEEEEAGTAPERRFDTVLKTILSPPEDAAVWPQSTLQAKSLVSQLLATADRLDYDAAGLEILKTDMAPWAK
ncbi:hypothetical protein GGF46_003440 [Coemansia sp. RSA 552]|nr:hypothetical protein GGF46_003440 [Coemansia sp. RSA 552]